MSDDDQPRLPFEPEAFEDLPQEVIDSIRGKVTFAEVLDYVSQLSDAPLHAEPFRLKLTQFSWWRPRTKVGTQLRRMRTIRDAAISYGWPVCTINAGYLLGDWAMVLKTARRATRMAEGAHKRAAGLTQLAERMVTRG
jgi:hypothetical protein